MPQPSSPSVAQLTARAVQERLQAAQPTVLIDVREDWEVALCRLPGAQHLPLGQLLAAPAPLQVPEGSLVVFYCHHGLRSLRAAQSVVASGVLAAADVANLEGGIDAWSRDVDAAVARY